MRLRAVAGDPMRAFARVPADTPARDLVDPSFWVKVKHRLRAFAVVVVIPDDGAWYAELLCTRPTEPRMHVLTFRVFEARRDCGKGVLDGY